MNKTRRSLYLCVHVVQVLPACCVNRDDTGTPKSVNYGGTRRARVSSQCWKRQCRMYMQDHFGDNGTRHKHIVSLLSKSLVEEADCDEKKAKSYVKNVLSEAGIISKKEDAKDTSAFFSQTQIENIRGILLEGYRSNAAEKSLVGQVKDAIVEHPSESQLLFGRMFASDQSLNYDAACRVAHAFSVNEVADESDYFTVVSDEKSENASAGSDYIDSRLFNTGILYRYADVNLSEGSELLDPSYGIDAAGAATHFLEAFVKSMPSGSKTSYAHETVPEMVLVELRDDIPVNFAPAFVKAVRGEDITAEAVEKLFAYENKVTANYGAPVRRWVLGETSLPKICKQVAEEIKGRI